MGSIPKSLTTHGRCNISAIMTSIQAHFSNLQVNQHCEVVDALRASQRLCEKVNVDVHFVVFGSVRGIRHQMVVHMRGVTIDTPMNPAADKVMSCFESAQNHCWPFA